METGQRIAEKYELVRQVGVGGMGEVWAAYHARIDRHVAIKFPNVDLVKRPEIRERFLAEARVLGRLRHPNIVDVLDFGEFEDGGLYLVFELLDGTSLDAYVQEIGRLAPRTAVRIAIELVRGLAFAHESNVIHRDLKPANVFLHRAPDGRMQVKLLDFGISKTYAADGENVSLTGADVVVGTPAYMSFEQAKALPDIDARSDIWNVGVILYEMLTGLPPFEAPSYSSTVAKIVSEAAPAMSTWGAMVPAELEAIVNRCLAKNRDKRFQSASALQTALEDMLPRLSEPPPSRRLRLDSLADLPAMPPSPFDEPPPISASSLRMYSPCAVTIAHEESEHHSARPSQSTPDPTNVTLPDRSPAGSANRGRLAIGAIVLLAVGAGMAWGATHLFGSQPDQVVATQAPASGVVATPSATVLNMPEVEAPASASAPAPIAPSSAPSPVASASTAPAVPVHPPRPAKRSGATKQPTTLVDDPGF